MIKVLLADDHEILRNILIQIMQKAGDIQVVAIASNGEQAVSQAGLYRPDVTLLAISMPVMDGVEAARQICEQYPGMPVLIVSGYDTAEEVGRSIQAGASGYVLKDVASQDLVIAVRSLYEGKTYFSKQIADIAMRYIQK